MRRPSFLVAAALALLSPAPSLAGDAPPRAVPDPEAFLSIQGASLEGVSRDGETVLFRMQRDGTSQLFRTGPRGGWPHRVTFRKAPVGLAALSPDGKRVVVGYDHDGDEDAGLHLVDVATGAERALSVKPGVQHGSVVWARVGQRIFFRNNEDVPADFHLYEKVVADGATRRVLAKPGAWSVEEVDESGGRLLVSLDRSNTDASIYVLDLASGALAEIDPMPAGTTAAAGDARFVGDGREVLFLSDRGGEWRRAWIARREGDAVREVLPAERAGCDVDEALASRDGTLVWVVENRNGSQVLSARGGASFRREGVVSRLRCDDRGTLYYAFGSPPRVRMHERTREQDVVGREDFLTEVEWGGLSQESLKVAMSPRAVEIPSPDGKAIPAWLWEGPKRPGPYVVSFHGGPEAQARPWFSPDRAYLLSLGFGVLEPNVRGSTGYGKAYRDLDNYRGRLDAVKDGKACADWLVAQGYADPKRIAAVGGSYGGYMVLAELTRHPETWAAGVDVVGIANFETFLERTRPYRRALREAEYGPLTDRAFLRSISPIHDVGKITAPLLVAHGEQDPRVPVAEARQIVDALKAKGRPVEALFFPDEGHGWRKRENRATYLRAVADFLLRTIGR